jgi:putative DNA primase/helicase
MRDEIMEILEMSPEIRVVVLDNISCLFSGIDEDSKRDWEPISAWLLRLRHRGLATVLVHHAGKGGQQRGTSGREDSLDTVIQLEQPPGYDPQEGCHFELKFTKSRSVKGEDVQPLDVRLESGKNGLQWVWKPLEASKEDQVRRLVAEGITSPTDIAEELGITKGYASKLIRKTGSL